MLNICSIILLYILSKFVWVGVADVINHTKFGNDRSTEYILSYGGSHFALLHRNATCERMMKNSKSKLRASSFWLQSSPHMHAAKLRPQQSGS